MLLFRIAAVLCFLAVALGAFGAHSLRSTLESRGMVDVWNKAVFYHFIHAVMLFVLTMRNPLPRGPWFSFLLGIVLFSGSLYLYALTKTHFLVFVTPFGGISFIVGWICLVICPRLSDSK